MPVLQSLGPFNEEGDPEEGDTKKRSPTESYLVGSNDIMVWGSKLENVKKEKKVNKHNGLKIVECGDLSQVYTVLSN